VLTVPKEAAYEVAEPRIRGGVRGIWNFANMEFKTDAPGVIVENIHLGDSLMKLCYEIKTKGEEKE
jgi:redox-sensing transcriptional repressor